MILSLRCLHGVDDMKHTIHLVADRIAELRIKIQHGIMTVAEIIAAGEIQRTGLAEEYAQTVAAGNVPYHIIHAS